MGNQDDKNSVMIRDFGNGVEFHWKFNQLLSECGISYYRLHQSNPTKFTMGTMSRWHTSVPKRPEMEIVSELLKYLSELTQREITLDMLMEFKSTEEAKNI